jgi:V/A-type H+/Na+-transporting ATPase subunit I
MFRTVPMMRLQAVVLARDERAVLKGLGRLGAAHLTHMRSGSETAPLTPVDYSGELARYDRTKTRVQELRQALEINYPAAIGMILPLTGKPRPSKMALNQVEENLLLMEQKAGELLGNRQRLIQHRKELAAVCEQVSCYRGFEIPLDGLDRFSFLHFVTGSLPEQNFEDLRRNAGENVVLLPVTQQKGRQSFFAITTRQAGSALESTLQQAGFQREMLPVAEGKTVDELSEEREKEKVQLASELEELNGKLKTMATEFAFSLGEIEELVDTEYKLLDASQKFSRTEASILITGWVPASDVAILEQQIGEITDGRYVIQTTLPDPATEEQVPVLLRHSRLLRPFEMLVSTYGLPNYRELEPTLFVALSYVVMFGMMFGDAGHGTVLASCGLIALLGGRSRNTQDIGVLLLFGGLSSTVFGVVYGSYFGIEALKKYALWHDPLEGDPMQLMYGAMGIGITMISLGLLLNVINRFRQGDVIGGILDKFGLIGLLFYWGTLVLLMNEAAIRSRGLMSASIFLFLVVPIIGWSLKEPIEHFLRHRTGKHNKSSEGMAGAIIESCVGAFEAILSYLANTISFVRLAAYAMSHAALLFAAFMLAAEVRSFPVGGGIFSIVVIIIGNLIAIVLEGVIASVQALRLEYYEFFGKFFSGSGQPFEPFCLKPDDKDPGL